MVFEEYHIVMINFTGKLQIPINLKSLAEIFGILHRRYLVRWFSAIARWLDRMISNTLPSTSCRKSSALTLPRVNLNSYVQFKFRTHFTSFRVEEVILDESDVTTMRTFIDATENKLVLKFAKKLKDRITEASINMKQRLDPKEDRLTDNLFIFPIFMISKVITQQNSCLCWTVHPQSEWNECKESAAGESWLGQQATDFLCSGGGSSKWVQEIRWKECVAATSYQEPTSIRYLATCEIDLGAL